MGPGPGRTKESAKRRLPVVQNNVDPAEEPRPAWQWVGFGTASIFIAWLPLAWLAGKLGHPSSLVLTIVPQLIGLAIASMAGGYLVGRYGSGVRDATIAGAVAGGAASLLAIASGGASAGLVIVVALVALFSFAGGKLGVRRKAR